MKTTKKPFKPADTNKVSLQEIEKSVFDLPEKISKKEIDNVLASNFEGVPKKINLDGVLPFVPKK